MKSELEIDVRYYETDQMGVVHHSNYIRYFECGRSDMMQKAGLPVHKIEEAGIVMPVVAVNCRYRLPARLGDRLRIVSMTDELPKARLVVKSEVYNQDGQLLCSGDVTLGFLDARTRRPVRCPDSLLAVIKEADMHV